MNGEPTKDKQALESFHLQVEPSQGWHFQQKYFGQQIAPDRQHNITKVDTTAVNLHYKMILQYGQRHRCTAQAPKGKDKLTILQCIKGTAAAQGQYTLIPFYWEPTAPWESANGSPRDYRPETTVSRSQAAPPVPPLCGASRGLNEKLMLQAAPKKQSAVTAQHQPPH